jgi:hypothetical protein
LAVLKKIYIISKNIKIMQVNANNWFACHSF